VEFVSEALEIFPVAAAQVIDHYNVMPGMKMFHQMAADKTGPAGNEDSHQYVLHESDTGMPECTPGLKVSICHPKADKSSPNGTAAHFRPSRRSLTKICEGANLYNLNDYHPTTYTDKT